MDQIVTNKRPAEITRNYIESKFLSPGVKPDGYRLPTIHEFAKHLSVSPSTVRSVFKTLAEEGKLITIPGKGTFLKSEPGAPEPPSMHNCLGVNISLEATGVSHWGGGVFLGVTNEALKENMMVKALQATQPTKPTAKDLRKMLDHVDGIIALPGSSHFRDIERICVERNLPLVHINPPHFHHTSNFVSNDYFTSVYHLALALREAGRRKVVLVFAGPINSSVSSAQVYSAFSLAYASCHDAQIVVLDGECSERDEFPFSPYKETGYQRMARYLQKSGRKVDAVYCFGDYLAEGAAAALSEAGLSLPEDVSLVGGTGLEVRLASGPLVTLKQPLQEIGGKAVRMLLWRIRNDLLNAPGVYLLPELSEGNTIRTKERTAYERLIAASRNNRRSSHVLP